MQLEHEGPNFETVTPHGQQGRTDFAHLAPDFAKIWSTMGQTQQWVLLTNCTQWKYNDLK